MKRLGFLLPLVAVFACSAPTRQTHGLRSEACCAGAEPTLTTEEVALAGCVAGISEPNARQYAKRVVQAGGDPDYALSEGRFAMGQLRPFFEEACVCVFRRIGSYDEISRAAVAKGGTLESELAARFAAAGPEGLSTCVNGEALMARAASLKDEIQAFRRANGKQATF